MIKKLKILLLIFIVIFQVFLLSGCVEAEDVSFNTADEEWES